LRCQMSRDDIAAVYPPVHRPAALSAAGVGPAARFTANVDMQRAWIYKRWTSSDPRCSRRSSDAPLGSRKNPQTPRALATVRRLLGGGGDRSGRIDEVAAIAVERISVGAAEHARRERIEQRAGLREEPRFDGEPSREVRGIGKARCVLESVECPGETARR